MTALLKLGDEGVDAENFRGKILRNDENGERTVLCTHLSLLNRLPITPLSSIGGAHWMVRDSSPFCDKRRFQDKIATDAYGCTNVEGRDYKTNWSKGNP